MQDLFIFIILQVPYFVCPIVYSGELKLLQNMMHDEPDAELVMMLLLLPLMTTMMKIEDD